MAGSNCCVLWQKQVTVIGFIDLDSQINHTGVAQFQHAVCHCRHCRTVWRQRFALTSLFFVAPRCAYSWSFWKFFSAADVNSVLSLKRMKITSFSNCFQQRSLAWRFVSIICPARVSKHFKRRSRWKNDLYDPRSCNLMFKQWIICSWS